MPDNCVEPPSHPCIAHFLSYSMLERKELLFCVTIVLSFMCRQTHPSPVQIISHSLDQLILKPNSPSLMGTSVGSPDMGDAFKSSVCHSHHHPTPQTPPTSSAAMPLGQRSPVPGWLSIPAQAHPVPGSMHNRCSKLTAAPTRPGHQNISPESQPAHHAPSMRGHRACALG